MYEKYGVSSFTEPVNNGKNLVITTLQRADTALKHSGSLGNSWVVGRETNQNIPVVILDPAIPHTNILEPVHILAQEIYEPIPSKGVVYWYSNQPEFVEKERTKKVSARYPHSERSLGLLGYNVVKETEGNSVWYTITNTNIEDPLVNETYSW